MRFRARIISDFSRSAPVPGRSNAPKAWGVGLGQGGGRFYVAAPGDERAPHPLGAALSSWLRIGVSRAAGKICLWAVAACESMETVDVCGDKLNWRRLRETLD